MTPDIGRQLTLDVEEEVFRHLLFHRSLIDDSDEDDYSKLSKYMDVLSEMNEGVHVSIKDPYSRSIAMVLELATECYMDPWNLDLIRFCKMFLKKVKKEERTDLMVMGKLIRMAYTVHLMKSENTLKKAELGSGDDDLDEDDAFFEWMEDDETFEVTRNILQESSPPIVESILHKGDRPVTLVDLLNALDDVSGEVEELKKKREDRVKALKEQEKENRSDINNKVYKENTEEDIRLTWQRVNQFNGHPIPLSRIEEDFELDVSSTLISILYLANWERIRVWQRSFPHGEIMIKNLSNGDDDEMEFGDLKRNIERATGGKTKMKKPEMIVEKKPIPDNWNT